MCAIVPVELRDVYHLQGRRKKVRKYLLPYVLELDRSHRQFIAEMLELLRNTLRQLGMFPIFMYNIE